MDLFRLRTAVSVLTAAAALTLSACGSTVQVGPSTSLPAATSDGLTGGIDAAGGVGAAPDGPPVEGGNEQTESGPSSSSGDGTATGATSRGSGTQGGTGSGPTTAAATRAGRTDSASRPPAGSTTGSRVTAPVSLGFIVEAGNGQQANESAGVSTGGTVTLGSVTRGLVKAFNAAGGMSGRRIEPVYYETDPTAPDYGSERTAACAKFTQDAKVAAALTVSGFDEGFARCLRQGGAYQVDSGSDGTSAATLAATSNHLSTSAPSMERRERGVVAVGVENGSFRRGTVVGVVVDSCAETRAGYEKGLVPSARAAGLTLVTVEVQCVSGFSDLGSIAASLQNAVLRFRSSGATQVTFVSNVESTEVILFTQAAESQGYRPGYVLTSSAQPVAQALNDPAEQLARMTGMGWQPALDAAVDKQPTRTATQTRCLALLRSANVVPQGSSDLYYIYSVCDTFFAYERLLADTRGRSTISDIGAAAARLGSSLRPVGTFGLAFAAGRLDGPATRRAFRYDVACSCFLYSGPERPLQ